MTPTMTPTSFTESDYVHLNHVFSGGDITKATRAELERFTVMLSRPNAYTHFGAASFPQICESVRMLLQARINEEANIKSNRPLMESSKLHPWPIIRSVLLELSSYEVPKVVDRAGLKVDWKLTTQQNYSDKMRIAAYRPRIDAAYDELPEADRLRASYIVADELALRGLGEKLDAALRAVGWRMEAGKLMPDTTPVRELFFPMHSQHDAYVEVRRILQTASKSITIVDPYLDQTILTLLTSSLQPGMVVRLLTSKLPSDFTLEAKIWLAQHPHVVLEVRTTKEFHDRFIVVDDHSCWHVGCSIKDAGNKAFMLSAVEDGGSRAALLAHIETSWRAGTVSRSKVERP